MKLNLFLLSICLVGTALASQKPNYIKFTCNAPMWTGTWYGKNDDCSTAAGMTKPSVIEFDKCVTHTMNTGWKVKYAKGTDKKKVTYEVFEPKKKCATVLKTHKDLETEKCLSHPDNVLAAPAENSAFSTMKSGIVSMVFTAILAIIFTF
eukprot:g14637.t1